MRYSKFTFLYFLSLLTGCATGYQSTGLTGGFNDVELAPGYFRISFQGNGLTSKEQVNDFALLRASDLMLERGCNTFKILKSAENIQHSSYVSPKTETTNINIQSLGHANIQPLSSNVAHIQSSNTSYGQAYKTTSGGNVISTDRHQSVLEVGCSSEEANYENGILDANFLNKTLKKKYKIIN